MASKGSKRANSSAGAPVAKKTKESAHTSPKKVSSKKVVETPPKTESVFASIVTALRDADSLPERCREMLVAMAEPCLSMQESERHAIQVLGVSMIEETLQDLKAKQMSIVEQAQEELSKLEECKASCVDTVSKAQVDLTSKEEEEASKQCACEAAKNFEREAEGTLAHAKETERQAEEPLAKLHIEKATLEKISEEHVKAPMEINEGPHFHALAPHIQSFGLDESLAIALPSSCAKTKEQRGGFDDVVLGELEKALAQKIGSLTRSISEEMPRVAERKAAATSAESALGAKAEAAKAAALELTAAKGARLESAAALSKANEEVQALEPSIREAMNKLEELKKVLNDFEIGPLATFQSHRKKAAAIEEAAPAGA